MELGAIAQWGAFAIFAFIAVAGALGMATTMSMFRSAIFLMASFIGVAGLFILLLADLLGLLQVMMYIGGMLVMALFMVLFSGDPGGDMMSSHMKLVGPEKWFSAGLAHMKMGGGGDDSGDGDDGGGHEGHSNNGEGGGEGQQGHDENGGEAGGQNGHGGGGHGGGGGGHGDMSMFTPAKTAAMILAPIVTAGLVVLLLLRPDAWPTTDAPPDPDSARRVGELLMGPYMIAFEGAGLLILLGIFGAVYVARPGRYPDPTDRDRIQAAVDAPPAPVEPPDAHAPKGPEGGHEAAAEFHDSGAATGGEGADAPDGHHKEAAS